MEAQRYPTIESPDAVTVNQKFSVQVALTKDLETPESKVVAGPTTEEGKLELNLPNQNSWQIEVVLSAIGFSILQGDNQRTLTLPKGEDSPPVVFELRAKPIGTHQQTGRLFVTFYFKGGFLGRAMREVAVFSGPTPSETPRSSEDQDAQLNSNGGNDNSGSSAREETPIGSSFSEPLRVGARTPVPDLTIYMRDYGNENRTGMSDMTITSPWLQLNCSTFRRPEGLASWLSTKYREFARLTSGRSEKGRAGRASTSQENSAALLRGFGRELYQKFAPPAFKEAFWKLVDKSKQPGFPSGFKTILIYSDNPILPWELMRPVRPDGTGERDFLGVEFSVGRWHVTEGTPLLDRPPLELPILSFYVIAPDYQGNQALTGQKEELEALQSFHGYEQVKGQFGSLRALLNHSSSGIVHFAGHGVVRIGDENIPEYFILLEDGEVDPLRWRGMVTSHTDVHQFVFFNACDVGQVTRVANFVDGWAPAVLETGASGYVGALWPLGDRPSANFAIHFYETLAQRATKGPVPVADVLRETRGMFLKENDPTYLAYVYYGDPNLELRIP
jgi:hypothetical protein